MQVWADSKPLTVPVQTAYKSFKSQRQYGYPRAHTHGQNTKDCYRWAEWLTLPINYCDLPLSAQLAITVWDLGGPGKTIPFGGTTVRLFDADKYGAYNEVRMQSLTPAAVP